MGRVVQDVTTGPLAVEGVAQRINDAANQGITDRHADQFARGPDLVAFDDLPILAENDQTDRVFFEVEPQSDDLGPGELDHFAGHDAASDREHMSDTVADFEAPGADLADRPALSPVLVTLLTVERKRSHPL